MTPLRELFKKNDFGALASPFYERLVEPKRIEGFKKKLQQLHISLMERARRFGPFGGPPPFDMMMAGGGMPPRPMMGGRFGHGPMGGMPPMRGQPPPAPYPDQAMQRINALERELALMRSERSKLGNASGDSGPGGAFGRANTDRSRFDSRFDDPFENRGAGGSGGAAAAVATSGRFDQDIFDLPPRHSFEPFDRTARHAFSDNFNEQPLKRMRPDFGRNDTADRFEPFDRFGGGGNSGGNSSGNRFGGNQKDLPSLFDSGAGTVMRNRGPPPMGGNSGNSDMGGGFGSLLNRPAYLHLSGSVSRGNNQRPNQGMNNQQRGRFGGGGMRRN